MNIKRRTWYIGSALIVIIIVGAVVGLMLNRSDVPSTTTANGQATVEVVRGDISRTLTVYGEVAPKQEYTFTFDGDRVNEIPVSVGQRVEQGKVLASLDRTQLELSLLQAERALQEAQAEGIPAVIREKELSHQIALTNYEDATLRAPFAGVVTEINQATTSAENRPASRRGTSSSSTWQQVQSRHGITRRSSAGHSHRVECHWVGSAPGCRNRDDRTQRSHQGLPDG